MEYLKLNKNNTRPLVIAFAGRIGAGKSTMAKLFEHRYKKIKRISYSSKISHVAEQIWGSDMKFSRPLLQKIGQIAEYTMPNMWDKLIRQDMVDKNIDSYIIDGLRYQANFKWCHANNIPILYFDIPKETRLKNILKRSSKIDFECLDHPGELQIEQCKSYATWFYGSDCTKPPCKIVDLILDYFNIDQSDRNPWNNEIIKALYQVN